MKIRFALFLLALAGWNFSFSQNTEGIVTFEEKVNMHRHLPPDDAQIRSMVPEFRTSTSELLFKDQESLYRNVEEEEDDEVGGGPVVIKMQRPEATYYRDFAAGKKVDQREFMGKRYLIEDTIAKAAWKVTGESKTILGYNCLQATWADTANQRQVVAWFTDAVSMPGGPAVFGLLPGMILEVDVNGGELIFTAKKVEFKKLKKGELAAPTKGEKITQAEFKQKMDEQMKRMGGPGVKIIRN